MNAQLFARIKKIVRKEGKAIIIDENDAFVILPLDEYEMLTEDFYGEECNCGSEECDCETDHDLGEEIFMNDNEKSEEDSVDQDLIKRVNEDIAKWREEQQKQENKEIKNQEIKKSADWGAKIEENLIDLGEVSDKSEAKEDVLTEEERYYLEPLE